MNADFGLCSPEFIHVGFHLLGRLSVPIFLSLLFSKTSMAPPLLHCLKRLAKHFLSTWGCHLTPSLSSFRTNSLFCFLLLRNRVYKCLTVCSFTPHHQHSESCSNTYATKWGKSLDFNGIKNLFLQHILSNVVLIFIMNMASMYQDNNLSCAPLLNLLATLSSF